MSPRAKVASVKKLSGEQTAKMYEIFARYYDGVSEEIFLRDLYAKNDVILLSVKNRIVGFSTLLCRKVKSEGAEVLGIYSGDTVLEKEYWGSSALGICFLQYLWKKKVTNPNLRVFWFLISKGYKTYLLMANNFELHYPRFEKATPSFEKGLMNAFYGEHFAGDYQPENGLVVFNKTTCRLKGCVAPISQELKREVPRVDFFTSVNPRWEEGQELACIAEMSFLMPAKYFIKKTFKFRPKFSRKPTLQPRPKLAPSASRKIS